MRQFRIQKCKREKKKKKDGTEVSMSRYLKWHVIISFYNVLWEYIYIYIYIYLYICTDDKLQFCLGQFFTYATLYSRLSLRLDPLLHKQGKMARYRKKKGFM